MTLETCQEHFATFIQGVLAKEVLYFLRLLVLPGKVNNPSWQH